MLLALTLLGNMTFVCCNSPKETMVSKGSTEKAITDSVESHCIYNDSVEAIIKNASNVILYQMVGLVQDLADSIQRDSLFNYLIEKKIGKLNRRERDILDFIISDSSQYRADYPLIRQPFNPNFTLEFTKGRQKVFYMVSLGTGEIAIADTASQFKFFLMRNVSIIERWYDYVLLERTKKDKK